MMNWHLGVLAESQRRAWDLFAECDLSEFVLYGGTALALRLGHRQSVDFDFFRRSRVTEDIVKDSFPWLRDARLSILQQEPDTYVVMATGHSMHTALKLSFFGGLTFGQIEPPKCAPNGVRVASFKDIFATKLAALHNRIECKDYQDISELLKRGFSLAQGISFLKAIHPDSNPAVIARALCFFEGGDLDHLGIEDRRILETAVANLGEVPEPPITSPIGSF
jgi:hypothetical protein